MDEIRWRTHNGDRVTVFANPSAQYPGEWRWYWHVRAAGNHAITEHGQGYTRRRNAVRAALRHHPIIEEDQ